MNDADIARLWAERTLEPVAMSGTITRAADDVDYIARRLKEIAEERRQSDPDHATGDNLDRSE